MQSLKLADFARPDLQTCPRVHSSVRDVSAADSNPVTPTTDFSNVSPHAATHRNRIRFIASAPQRTALNALPLRFTAAPLSYQPRLEFTNLTTDSITGTSIRTPTTVASA